jgi:hypothetical protein
MGSSFRPLRLEPLEERWPLDAMGFVAAPAWPLSAEGEGTQVPDFSLVNTNSNSPTYNQNVSPRDFLGQVSAWYFGHAT